MVKTQNDTKSTRLFQLLFKLLNSYGTVAISSLYDKYACSRTLKRDLEELNQLYEELMMYPLFFMTDSQKQKTTELRQDGTLVLNRKTVMDGATSYEIAIIFANLQLLGFLQGTIFSDLTEGIQGKMKELLGQREKTSWGKVPTDLLQNLDKQFYFYGLGTHDYALFSETLEEIYNALVKRRMIIGSYVNQQGVEKKHRLKPLTIVLYKNTLYLLGKFDWAKDHYSPVPFRIDGFTSVSMDKGEDGIFEYPSNYSPEDYFRGDFGIFRFPANNYHVIVEFPLDLKRYLSTKVWHKDQLFSSDEHTCRLEFHTSNLIEVKTWVLSFGSVCKVLSPVELVDQIKDELEKIWQLYNSEGIKKVS